MKNYRLGVIRVVTYEDAEQRDRQAKIIEAHFPQITTVSRCIQDQPTGIHDDATKALAIPKIISLAKEFSDVDALVVSCADDPGVAEIRKLRHDIPVVGAGESAITMALRMGEKIALIGISSEPPSPFKRYASRIMSYARPDGIESTLDINTKSGQEAIFRYAWKQKDEGADVIALACTGMSNYGLAAKLEKELNIPVVDPVIAEGAYVYYEMVRNKGLLL